MLFFGLYEDVKAHWTSTLGGLVANLSGGAKCDSTLSYASCRESICKSEGIGDCQKNFCKTHAEIIKYHRPCACAAGLTTLNCPSETQENDPAVTLNRTCRSSWAKAKNPLDCRFCEKYRDKCTHIEGLFDWCTEKCPDSPDGTGENEANEGDDEDETLKEE
ncbi:MAG: hypothetical protein JSS34_03605 [Proteobacteria bacterium]|nr:hypothetical protein [Pseudomonadota bacterium]